jgi:hypothetical protein
MPAESVMRVSSPTSRFAGALVFVTASGILTWFWTVPVVMSQSTFMFLAVFLLGGTAVALVTWRNAQATGSTAQILHETEVAPEEHRRV